VSTGLGENRRRRGAVAVSLTQEIAMPDREEKTRNASLGEQQPVRRKERSDKTDPEGPGGRDAAKARQDADNKSTRTGER
jgi:hypothetical protein